MDDRDTTPSSSSGKDSSLKQGEKKESGPLGLKKTFKTGQVWQNVSRGRSRAVMVEVKRKPQFSKPASGRHAMDGSLSRNRPPSRDSHILTDEERQARQAALQAGARRPASSRMPPPPSRMPPPPPPSHSSPARDTGEASEKHVAKNVRAAPAAEEKPASSPQAPGSSDPSDKKSKTPPRSTAPTSERKNRRNRTAEKPVRPQRRGTSESRREGKLTIVQALDSESKGERVRSLAALRRAREREKIKMREQQQTGDSSAGRSAREIIIPDTIAVADLANRMAVRGKDVIKSLKGMGLTVTIDQQLDADTAELVVDEFGHKSKRVSESDVEIGLGGQEDDPTSLQFRAPVVVVMGHVDHGKTSLLDALRESNVAVGEAGGITQHIGAYRIKVDDTKFITFLDTPGHEAFRAMRERGANVTDIAVLVVAADDGIQPQTIEAIDHAKAAKVPIIVAVNKMDTPGADPTKVYNDLLRYSIVVEKMGGDVLVAEISAKKKENLEKLTEAILLQAEILDLKGNTQRSASGSVIEARMKKGQGSVATVLIQRGTIKVGDIFVSGWQWGKVRALMDQDGNRIASASLSIPVEVLGFSGAPEAGDDFIVVENEARAREIARYRERKLRAARPATVRSTVEDMLKQKDQEKIIFPLIIKGDTRGSVDAVATCLEALSNDAVQIYIISKGIGDVNESDIASATTSKARVIAFHVRADHAARDLARRDGIDVHSYTIIYNIIEEMKKIVEKLSHPKGETTTVAQAEVLQIFDIGKLGKVAGSRVTEGTIRKGVQARVLRGEEVIVETKVTGLRREKDEVNEVKHGLECGIVLVQRDKIEVGDIIECFTVKEES